jgi:hypothetical protein
MFYHIKYITLHLVKIGLKGTRLYLITDSRPIQIGFSTILDSLSTRDVDKGNEIDLNKTCQKKFTNF